MRPLSEKLRYILLRGHLCREGNEWIWTAAPDCACEVRELKGESRWLVVEVVYDMLKGIRL